MYDCTVYLAFFQNLAFALILIYFLLLMLFSFVCQNLVVLIIQRLYSTLLHVSLYSFVLKDFFKIIGCQDIVEFWVKNDASTCITKLLVCNIFFDWLAILTSVKKFLEFEKRKKCTLKTTTICFTYIDIGLIFMSVFWSYKNVKVFQIFIPVNLAWSYYI